MYIVRDGMTASLKGIHLQSILSGHVLSLVSEGIQNDLQFERKKTDNVFYNVHNMLRHECVSQGIKAQCILSGQYFEFLVSNVI